MTNPLDLAAIEARCNAATEGPWRNSYCRVLNERGAYVADSNHASASFIEHSRSDIPDLMPVRDEKTEGA